MIRLVFFFISCIGLVITATSKSIYNLASLGIIKISETKFQKPTLSPNSTEVAYDLQNKLFVLNLFTKITKQITTKQFDWAIYPEKNHGISGGNTRVQLYTKMTNFIKENL